MFTKLNMKQNCYIQTYISEIFPRVKFSNTKTHNPKQQRVQDKKGSMIQSNKILT